MIQQIVTNNLIHVKGRQDAVIPQMAWMNIEMDLAAKQKANSTLMNSGPWKIPGEHGAARLRATN